MKTSVLSPLVLAAFTLVTRLLFHGPPYFVDGPAHIRAILEKVYIIQPPGYWLFNRTAGLFADPVIGISTMNVFFSVAGVVVFYYAALFFTGRRSAFLAALAYSSVFYIWFSGEVHSTHTSQVLFPVATFLTLLCYEQDKANWKLWLAGIIFAVGAGLRPSDGVFLLPMLLYYSAARLTRRKAIFFLALIFSLCLAWIVPTFMAYSHVAGGIHGAFAYTRDIATQKSIAHKVNAESMANITRFVLPILVAFWPVLTVAVLNAARNWKDWRTRMLVLWIVPGSLFFTLSYISDAPYLNFLSAAILLLAVSAPRLMALTALSNAIVFLGFVPIPSSRLPVNVWNCYIGHFTRYGVKDQWFPNLSALQGSRSPGGDHNEPKN